MRLLIYLLALISGFSAADAARAEVTPASSVAQTAIAAAVTLAAHEQRVTDRPLSVPTFREAFTSLPFAPLALPAITPVSRRDNIRE
jgi:hypothetical protein